MIRIKGKVGRAFAALVLAFAPALVLGDLAYANCVNPGQEAAVAAAQQAETSSPVVTVIETCGGDDTSYQIPLSVDVTFDGQTFDDVFVTTNSVITFGRPDGTYWDYPQTPSISLYSMDWVVYPGWRGDEGLVIRSSDGGFQVDISARPIWLQNAESPTNIVITAAILSDGTVAMAYSVDGPTYDGQTRTGVRLNDGSVVNFEEYGIEEVEESPELSPEPTTESPFVPEPEPTPEPETESPTTSPETESPESESPTAFPEPETESPTVSPETESPTVSPETESPTVSPEPEVSDPNTIVLVVSEGELLSYVAPEGYKIDSISSASYGTGDGCHAVDSQIIVESAVTNESFSISATNDVFGDPCPGAVKRLEVVVVIQELPAIEPEPSQSPEATPEPVAPVPVVPSPEPQPSTPEPVQPEPQPELSPEPTPEPSPEPTPEPEPVQPEPTPEPTPDPTPTVEPTPEPSPEPVATPQPQSSVTPTPTPVPTPSPSVPEPSPTPIVTPEPSPEPTPSPIPEPVPTTPQEVTLDTPISDVMSVVENISPTSLTQEEVSVLVDIAMQTFETAEQGSEEYEQALELLLVAAQADDIIVDEELASTPVIGAAVVAVADALNALGNAGADMSPQVREQSEKVVIASVIVANIAMTATSAATSAAAAAARRP